MTTKKRTKTKDKVLSLSKEESDLIGIKVYNLMKTDLKFIVNKYVMSYRSACKNILGWDDEDIKQYIAEILWKGVATFDDLKNVKLTTYLSAILYYQMANLSKSLQKKKRYTNTVLTEETLKRAEEAVDETTTEDWIQHRNKFSVLLGNISKKETNVLILHLLNGFSVEEMKKELKLPRTEIISILKGINEKLKIALGD